MPVELHSPRKPRDVCIVVDGYSSGRFLIEELHTQEWDLVGIQSSLDLADFWLTQFDKSMYVHTIQHKTLKETVAELDGFNVKAVFAGSEPGVILSEELQDHFGIPGNGSETTMWRREKFDMQERLRDCGVRAIRQCESGDVEELICWQKQWGVWPVIIKPPMSGGTDGVYWCHNEQDIREAHEKECGKLNCNGIVNSKLLVQEFLDGIEYVVDCVSHEGKHVLSALWEYKKIRDPATKSISYEYARMIEATGEIQDQIVPYAMECLDALHIKYGPSHSEVIMCHDGPCLVETGARLHGLKGPKMVERATGLGTHELAIDVAINGARLFNQIYDSEHKYIVKKWVFESMFRNVFHTGILKNSIDTMAIRSLPSVTDVFPSVFPGDELKFTRDLATAPGAFLQVHPSLEQCFKDLAVIREMEKTHLYETCDKMPKSPRPAMQSSPYCMSPVASPHASPMPGCDQPAFREISEFELDGLDL